MSTGTWEPGGTVLPDSEDLLAAAALWRELGGGEPSAEVLEEALASPLRERLRAAMQAPRGALEETIAGLDVASAEQLVRLFTVLEALPGFEAGARSPVIPLARHLKTQLDGEAFAELVRWVRAHTENRFIPHGSLQDRLRA